jgi:DNA polymerase V
MMFALVDCNNFYASCEHLFQPKLEKKPLAILSNNDGIVIARSPKAKALGVKMGQPAFELKDDIEKGKLKVLSSNFSLYADMSQRVMQTLSTYSPDMEIYSIDEAFFLLEKESNLRAKGIEMRKKVKKWTGIPISIGIAPTKTLAKLANEAAKKGETGVLVLSDSAEIEERLGATDLEEIWGIGSRLSQKLRRKGIYTAKQLRDCEDNWIRKLLGVTGYRTVLELRGVPCFELMEEPEKKKKSIVCSRSFSQKIDTLSVIEAAVASFATRAAKKLRDQKSLAGFLSVFVATSPFSEPYVSHSCHVQIPNPTSFTPELITLAKEGLSKIYQPGLGYKKAGILLADFIDEEAAPLDFLTPRPTSLKKAKAMKIVDAINARAGKEAIRFASQGVGKKWQGARSHVSPKFTTSWSELLKI